jgi:hypothetical protein
MFASRARSHSVEAPHFWLGKTRVLASTRRITKGRKPQQDTPAKKAIDLDATGKDSDAPGSRKKICANVHENGNKH